MVRQVFTQSKKLYSIFLSQSVLESIEKKFETSDDEDLITLVPPSNVLDSDGDSDDSDDQMLTDIGHLSKGLLNSRIFHYREEN